ncbi:hypothetical protein [Rhodopirellula bahusiensis]|uniref:hypothetical protein n=1 Tax=Rhodopirellula bahusiensis TaxID=2014065 RepID=UPI003266062B
MDNLASGSVLRPGEAIKSNNGCHIFAYRGDGNIVLYSLGKAIWSPNTTVSNPKYLAMQKDGNLVAYTQEHIPYWASATGGENVSLFMQDDRNAVIYTPKAIPIWSTGTHTAASLWEEVKFEIPKMLMAQIQDDDSNPINPGIGISCTAVPSGEGMLICAAVAAVAAILYEVQKGQDAFGPGNEIRIIGGNISREAKAFGADLSDGLSHLGGEVSKEWKKLIGA